MSFADSTQDCQLASFLFLTGECIATPVNDPQMAQEHIIEAGVPGLADIYPETYLDHEVAYDKLYEGRMRVIIDRYLTVLTSARLHIMRCALHGLLYPPKREKRCMEDEQMPKVARPMSCPMPLCRKPYPKCAICLRGYGTPVVGYDHHMGHAAAHAFAFAW
ncbi:unnamed protein product, partial [Mesorhabditis belari]|uniref:Uncharacterized protein n=1 Tax=Mesorhabditis belari TaxID=2138241 RepID=A0AAF3FS29_9BILA